MTDSPTTAARPHLHGLMRVVIQLIWLAVVGLLLASFAAGVPVRQRQLAGLADTGISAPIAGMPLEYQVVYTSRLGPAEAAALNAWGFSLGAYAAYILAFEIGLMAVCALIGVFIFWRRPDDWMTLWMSFILVLLGAVAISPELPTLATLWAGWGVIYIGASMLGMVSNVYLLFLSPDGAFVPHWTRRMTIVYTVIMAVLAALALQGVARGDELPIGAAVVVAIFWFGILGLGIASQVYRYRRVSGPVQRQQTKWLVVGLVAIALGFAVNAVFLLAATRVSGQARLIFFMVRAPAASLCMVLLPICLAFSILRYRLWDIDLIIRRTLIYSGLTAALAGVYLVSIVVLQSLFGAISGDRDTPLVTVVSTLAIAALFVPLRRRLQEFIDRLFYRRKYDAAQTMAAFGAALRDETDLARLAEDSLDVVHATMQPAHVSLWLSPSKPLEKQ